MNMYFSHFFFSRIAILEGIDNNFPKKKKKKK